MAQNLAESTWVTISYGSFINQFSPYDIKSMQQLERTYTKNVRAKDVFIVIWNVY